MSDFLKKIFRQLPDDIKLSDVKGVATFKKDFVSKLNKEKKSVERHGVTVFKGQPIDEGKLELIATTEKPVKRWFINFTEDEGWFIDYYWEILDVSEKSINSERLDKKTLSLYKDHETRLVDDIMGSITGWRTVGDQLIFDAQVDMKNSEAKDLFGKIKRGVVKTFSIGYDINYNKIKLSEAGDGKEIMRCMDWQPLEVSAVSIPADVDAQIISVKNNKAPLTNIPASVENEDAIKLEDNNMSEKNKDKEKLKDDVKTTKEPEVKNEVDKKDNQEKNNVVDLSSIQKEKTRTKDIMDLCAKLGYNLEKAQGLIDSEKSIQEIKLSIMEEKILNQEKSIQDNNVATLPGKITGQENAGYEKYKKYVQRELGYIGFQKLFKENRLERKEEEIDGMPLIAERPKRMTQMSVVALMKGLIEAKGEVAPTSNIDIVQKAFATTDFPLLLADTLHRESYSILDNIYMRDFAPLVIETKIADFREKTIATVSGGPAAKKIEEGGSVDYRGFDESGEKIGIEEYKDGVKIEYRTFVNDDVMAIQRLLQSLPASLIGREQLAFWSAYTTDTMRDGNVFFHGDNALTGGTVSLSNAGINRAYEYLKSRDISATQKTKGRAGKIFAMQSLNTLVVPLSLAATAKSLLRSISADTAAGVNVWADEVQNLIITPYLTGNSWYAHGGNMTFPSFVEATLSDKEKITIDSKHDFDTDCMKVKGTLRVAYIPLDRRGGVKVG